MKPIIAIVTLYDEKLESYWMLPGYAQGLEEAGAAPVVLPLTSDPAALERYAHTFDGFLFPGGHDLAPSKLMNEANPSEQVIAIKSLEAFEKAADGKATKIIIPSNIQSLAGLATSLKELVVDTPPADRG